jgi:serine/threonine-protein kinase
MFPYELQELLGEGGVSQVYAARDTRLGHHVAIKLLKEEVARDSNFVRRLADEAEILGGLLHANIPQLQAVYLDISQPAIVMELVRGTTLELLLGRLIRLPLRECLAVLTQAVSGLAYAHKKGVVHRDIKPSNLIVTNDGVLKIMDFGIAQFGSSQRRTRPSHMLGTLLYASPEQIRGDDVDERSDLYSLAVLFYEMLSGSPPFTAENDHALMTAHLESLPPSLVGKVRDVDARIDSALMRALAKQPADRFSTVEEFGRAVGAGDIANRAADILQVFIRHALELPQPPVKTPSIAFRDDPPATRAIYDPSATRPIYDAAVTRPIYDPPATRAFDARKSNASNRHDTEPDYLILWPHPLSKMGLPLATLAAVISALAVGIGYIISRS